MKIAMHPFATTVTAQIELLKETQQKSASVGTLTPPSQAACAMKHGVNHALSRNKKVKVQDLWILLGSKPSLCALRLRSILGLMH